jgi:hypothetical protein
MPYRLRIYDEDDVLLGASDHELPQDAGQIFGGLDPGWKGPKGEREPITMKRAVHYFDGETERELTKAEEDAVFDGAMAGTNERMAREMEKPFPEEG